MYGLAWMIGINMGLGMRKNTVFQYISLPGRACSTVLFTRPAWKLFDAHENEIMVDFNSWKDFNIPPVLNSLAISR